MSCCLSSSETAHWKELLGGKLELPRLLCCPLEAALQSPVICNVGCHSECIDFFILIFNLILFWSEEMQLARLQIFVVGVLNGFPPSLCPWEVPYLTRLVLPCCFLSFFFLCLF